MFKRFTVRCYNAHIDFDNSVILPEFHYEYDAVYILVSAAGREQYGFGAPNWDDFPNDIPVPNTDRDAMQSYRHRYEYDKLGNILRDAYKEYVYNENVNNQLLKHDRNQSFNDYYYDQNGNVYIMPNMTYATWNHKNELIRAYGGYYSYYQYDYQGNRSRKVVEKNNIREERYYIGSFEVYRRYVNDSLDYERTSNNLSDGDKVFARIDIKDGREVLIRYQYDNHLGSACLELDEWANLISYEEYHPFGTTSYRAGRSETEVSLKRYKYCGKERDEETGLYYYGARYYASWLCRFVSVDPLNEKYPELSAYQYASNRPITMIDLDGLEAFPNPLELVRQEFQGFIQGAKQMFNSAVETVKSWFSSDTKQNQDVETENEFKGFADGTGITENPIILSEIEITNIPSFNIDKAVKHLNSNAKGSSTGRCGEYVGKALQEGGAEITSQHGYNYGSELLKAGFGEITDIKTYSAQKGDVAVYDKNDSYPYGHAQMFNGEHWVSDFNQNYWENSDDNKYGKGFHVYSKNEPPVKIYRHGHK